jgi:hypothetical protein
MVIGATAAAGCWPDAGAGCPRVALQLANTPYRGESVSLCAACFSTAGRVNGRLK